MRFYQFILLVILVLFVTSSPASASKNSKMATPGAPTSVLESNTPIQRYLKASPANGETEEERGISENLRSIMQKILNLFKSSKTKELQGLLKADDSIDDAFHKLKLNEMAIKENDFIETKMVVDLLKSKNFQAWYKHSAKVSKLSQEKPEAAMLTTLSSFYGEKEVATMILLSKDAWRRGTIDSVWASIASRRMEKALFNKWFNEGLDAKQVLEKVLGVRMHNIHRHSRAKFIWGDYNKWYTAKKLNW
ncbi:RxLR effector protein [Phytophthora megakarya]|uniref:RxLR effector protein n=1 Tax=Phytophthora megakarya TaxID=4795 RepID=A0A225V7W0_9STRA|nr:RxLR effector protein [Phytophthora megakarya]